MLPKQNIPSNLDLDKWSANDDISTLKPNDQDINRMQTLLVSDLTPQTPIKQTSDFQAQTPSNKEEISNVQKRVNANDLSMSGILST